MNEKAEVVIGEYKNKPVAFALFFNNFSTFLGKPGIYLEDLYVEPEMRGKSIGICSLFLLNWLYKEIVEGWNGSAWIGMIRPFNFINK